MMEVNIPYEKAQQILLDRVMPLKSVQLPLTEAVGMLLAQELVAEQDVPPFDRSPYDGYAFRAADTADASEAHPVTLRILEEVPAGAVPTVAVTEGTAVKILTGAPIPKGADAVCPYEKTTFTAETVTIFSPWQLGSNIVSRGEDVQKGAVLCRAGQVIDAGAAAALAAQGVWQPMVYPVPRIGILSTGSELAPDGAALSAGKIANTNHVMLGAALKKAGMMPVYLGQARDDVSEIAAALERGLAQCDAVLSTGGVSAGDYDLVPPAMERMGAEMLIQRVRLKPGMACAYAVKNGKLLCGLSGNPASALTHFYGVTLPALRRLAGHGQPEHTLFDLRLADDFPKKSPAGRLLRGKLLYRQRQAYLQVPKSQGNVVISSAIGCDVMGIVPAESGSLAAETCLKGFML